jgi:hypothetical protein
MGEPLSFRLKPHFDALLCDQAASEGLKPAAQAKAIVEAHLKGGVSTAALDDLAQRSDRTLHMLHSISKETEVLNQIIAHKEQEATADFAELGNQIDHLRADIATLFGAALESFAGVEPHEAVAFTQRFMYPGARR